MNQDQLKEKLLQIESDVEEFTLLFSGKKSKKVNGLYKPETKEILIHNKNFEEDNSMIYTAIHEFAHHVHLSKSPMPFSSRAHTNEFWNIFHSLLIVAEEKGIYQNIFELNKDFIALTKDIKENYLSKNGELMKDFGKLLIKAVNLCQINNVRFEDYVDRALTLNRTTATSIMKVFTMDVNPEIGFDNMKIVAGINDEDERRRIEDAFIEGQSVDMVKARIKGKKEPGSSRELLLNEKGKIEKTIERLNNKLKQIDEKIEELDDEE